MDHINVPLNNGTANGSSHCVRNLLRLCVIQGHGMSLKRQSCRFQNGLEIKDKGDEVLDNNSNISNLLSKKANTVTWF